MTTLVYIGKLVRSSFNELTIICVFLLTTQASDLVSLLGEIKVSIQNCLHIR
jgi:hypothetical protein